MGVYMAKNPSGGRRRPHLGSIWGTHAQESVENMLAQYAGLWTGASPDDVAVAPETDTYRDPGDPGRRSRGWHGCLAMEILLERRMWRASERSALAATVGLTPGHDSSRAREARAHHPPGEAYPYGRYFQAAWRLIETIPRQEKYAHEGACRWKRVVGVGNLLPGRMRRILLRLSPPHRRTHGRWLRTHCFWRDGGRRLRVF